MGGWIKAEKGLREDVRVRRMVAAFIVTPYGQAVTQGRYGRHAAVTMVLGALMQLWMYADGFARDDDTLELTTADIDELAGIEGFAQLLPTDWLEVLDATHVKLPDFQAHNGTEAKKRAAGAVRAARYRASHSNAQALLPSRTSVTGALLDQTKTETISKNSTARGSAVPNDAALILTPEIREWARANAPNVNPESALAEFCDYWRAVPGARGRKLDWPATFRNRLREAEARYNLQRLRGVNGGAARPPAPKPAECKHGLPPTGCVHCKEERQRARAQEGGPVPVRSVLQDLVDRVKP